MAGPLEGLKVLDIATIIAAPFAATLLADYGADVLKIELPGHGDGVRSFPPFKDGKPLWWKATNRNKKFATLDLRSPGAGSQPHLAGELPFRGAGVKGLNIPSRGDAASYSECP